MARGRAWCNDLGHMRAMQLGGSEDSVLLLSADPDSAKDAVCTSTL